MSTKQLLSIITMTGLSLFGGWLLLSNVFTAYSSGNITPIMKILSPFSVVAPISSAKFYFLLAFIFSFGAYLFTQGIGFSILWIAKSKNIGLPPLELRQTSLYKIGYKLILLSLLLFFIWFVLYVRSKWGIQ